MSTIRESSRRVLATRARSFRWGAWFLDDDVHDDAAILYAVCRVADDYADEEPDPELAHALLEQLAAEVAGESEPRPLIVEFLELAERRELDLAVALELLRGVKADIDGRLFQTDEELLRYCYQAAGTVGLMMCAVLGVKDPRARAHAIDLGVAMQLTNICRDVAEDAANDRVYLPAERLKKVGVTQEQLLRGCAPRGPVAVVVRDLLELAEKYYDSAFAGLHYIPSPSRRGIAAAAELYRAIGRKLSKVHRGNALRGRTIVSGPEKFVLLGYAAGAYVASKLSKKTSHHDTELHLPLRGLPGVLTAEF